MFTSVGFNGSNAYIGMSDAALPSGSADRTISFWFRSYESMTLGDYRPIFSYGTATLTNLVAIGISQGNPGGVNGSVFASQYGDGIFTPAAYNDGALHLVLVTFTAGTWEIFIDNVSRVSGAMTTSTTLNTGAIAKDLSSGEFFAGMVAHVRVYNYVLNSGQRSAVYNSGVPNASDSTVGAGLVGYWKLDELTGTNFVDSGSGAHNGTGSNVSFPLTATASTTVTVTPADAGYPGLYGTSTGSVSVAGAASGFLAASASASATIVVSCNVSTLGLDASVTATIHVGVATANVNTYATVNVGILCTTKVESKSPYLLSGRIRGG